MRLSAYVKNGICGLAARRNGGLADLGARTLLSVLQRRDGLKELAKEIASAPPLEPADLEAALPVAAPQKILCIGLNYAGHTAESQYKQPVYPTIFPRLISSLTPHNSPIIRPQCSIELDWEGELVAIIGKKGKHVRKAEALDYIAGYSVFNDASVRDYQFKSPQWTPGKNFDATGAFGPDFVTPDELPRSVKEGLKIETRLNGASVQCANTRELIFDLPTLVSTLSEFCTLEPGDLIVTGTPSGVGFARTPKWFMKDGDEVEVEIEGIGILRNPVKDETGLSYSGSA
jgi:2-keto-4-pentenoate hydratase/2-oxohepta-3-ene-1,7-dioic acid hydratase in catechol pathway